MAETTQEPAENESLVVNLEAEEKSEAQAEQVKQAETDKKLPPVPGPGTGSLPTVPSPPIAPQVGLADLEKQIEAERQAKARAQQQARKLQVERDQAIAFAQEAERRGISTYELYADNQIQSLQDQMDALTAQQEGAHNEADWKSVSEINKKLARLGGQLAQAEHVKMQVQQQRERAKAQLQQPRAGAQAQPAAPVPTDPVERASQGRTERTRDFLRRHPELVRNDGSLKRVAIEAHERALDEGFTVDTEPYFRHIEQLITAKPAQPGQAQQAQEPPAYAAPVARNGAPGGNLVGPGGTFVMTPKMRRLAEEQGVTPQEWASNYVKLLQQGRITPIT